MKCPKCDTNNPDTASFCADCGTQLLSTEEISAPTETLEAAREELTRGTTFADRYEIIEELGKGGMGKVYRVEDKKIKEEVALKLIKPEIASDKKTLERFSNELKMARKIAHRNVCRMFDLGEEKGTHYITMEYVPGEDLKGSIRRMGPLGAGKAIYIAKQVCEGLSEAHRLGVVHRDLKPQNIMIDKDGNARIMDFGIARSIAGKGITGAGVMIGTPEYMSPEQAEVKEVDQRSDIYSLGVILYEMVTGRVPFEGETPLGIAMKHKSEVPKDPKELNSQLPDDISRVILRCLEKDKEKRYQSAGEVRSELANIEKGIPTTEKIIPKRKPITSREITVTFGLKKLYIPALVVIALVIVAVIIWQFFPKKAAVPIPSDKPSLAVMYFENNTGDESLEYLRSGLSEWFITDLSQSRFINVLSGDRIFSILKKLNLLEARKYSSEDLTKVANQGRANHVLKGSYIKVGENFVITVMLQKPHTGEVISSKKVECRGAGEIPAKVDELTNEIKLDLNISRKQIASDIDREVGKITTSSPEAYKYYIEGRKYHTIGENRKSIPFMEKAVAIDPEFAMAYRSMAMAYGNLGYRSEHRKYIQKAFELTDRLSDKERYLIKGDFYRQSEETYDKAIEAYNKLLELYPKDRTGNINLGMLYIDLEEWEKVIEQNEVLIQDRDETYFPYLNMSPPYQAQGMYDKYREVLEYYLNNFSDSAPIRWALADNYIYQGNYDLALVELNKALSLAPSPYMIRTKGDIYLCKGDLIEAEKEYQKLLESEERMARLSRKRGLAGLYLLQGKLEKSKDQVNQGIEQAKKLGIKGMERGFHFFLGYLHLGQNNSEEALDEFNKALSSAVEAENRGAQRWALYWKGRTYLQMKSPDKAQRTADELKELIEKGMNRKEIRMYQYLMGMIELKRENFSKTIEYIKKGLSLDEYAPPAVFLDSLALSYYKSGDLDKAQEEYKRLTSLTYDKIYWPDTYVKSFYMLGKISEQKGWIGKAIEHYEKFLDLWKDADPGIPEVEYAKIRLTGLQK